MYERWVSGWGQKYPYTIWKEAFAVRYLHTDCALLMLPSGFKSSVPDPCGLTGPRISHVKHRPGHIVTVLGKCMDVAIQSSNKLDLIFVYIKLVFPSPVTFWQRCQAIYGKIIVWICLETWKHGSL